jgi:acyl carrier protein
MRYSGRRLVYAHGPAQKPEKDRILREVRAVMAQLGLGAGDVDPSARLVDDLEFDSLDWVDLALRLEAALDLELADEKLASLQTLQDVVDLVAERLAAAGAAG